MIQLQDLKGLSKEEIVDLILDQKQQPFEIYIFKSTKKHFSDPRAIWLDYLYLSYTGQMLYNIANEFSYKEVPPEDHESVLFLIRVNDINELAETLLDICCGYENNPENGEFDYVVSAGEYLAEVESGEIKPACPYFIKVIKEIAAEEG